MKKVAYDNTRTKHGSSGIDVPWVQKLRFNCQNGMRNHNISCKVLSNCLLNYNMLSINNAWF